MAAAATTPVAMKRRRGPIGERAGRVVLRDGARVGAGRGRAARLRVVRVSDRDAAEDRSADQRRARDGEARDRDRAERVALGDDDGAVDDLRGPFLLHDDGLVLELGHADRLRRRAGVDRERGLPRLLAGGAHVERVRARIDGRVLPRGRADRDVVLAHLQTGELRDAFGDVDRRVGELRLEGAGALGRGALAVLAVVAPSERNRALVRAPRARGPSQALVTDAEGELDAARRLEASALFELGARLGELLRVEELLAFAEQTLGDRRAALRRRAARDEHHDRASEYRAAS